MVAELKSEQILEQVINDSNFKNILKCFKNSKTSAFKQNFNNEYRNGVVGTYYGITVDNKLTDIIFPIFSSEKTITWNFVYLYVIKNLLPEEYKTMEDNELLSMIKCPLYYLDKYTGEMVFLALVSADTWVNHGSKGKNMKSVYFWNDKLPNNYCINSKQLKSNVFVNMLPSLTDKELKETCTDYATKYYARFNNVSNRSAETIIKNIATGLYAQLHTYLDLKDKGYEVRMDWYTEDDLGIDIQIKLENTWINIDVKSTKTKDLKIAKNRKETDFYAVCTWNKSKPILKGFLFKHNFWKSNILDTTEPTLKSDMYFKSLDEVKQHIIQVDDIYNVLHKYNVLKMKKNTRLFNAE